MAVVRSGSFSAAAEQSRVSRSLVSKRIRELEGRVGARLLHRTTRRVSLTAIGQEFFQKCGSILEELEQLEQHVGTLQHESRGAVRMRASHSITVLALSPAIAAFGQRYPGIKITLIVTDEPDLPLDLAEGGFDLAIHLAPLIDSSVVARRVMPMRWYVCASNDYLSRRGTPASVRDLAQHDCLVHVTQAPRNIWQFNGTNGPQRVKVEPRLLTNSVITLRDAALHGLGVAMLPAFCAAGDLARGDLVELLKGCRPPERPVCILFPQRHQQPSAVRLLIDYLSEWLTRSRIGGQPLS